MRLYSSSFPVPPERLQHYSVTEVGTIETNLSGIRDGEVRSQFNAKLGQMVYMYDFEIEIRFRAREGNLAFRTIAYGRESGVTTIKYAD